MNDGFEVTLTEETEKKLYEIMYSMDVNNTSRFWIKDKRGYSAFYEKVIHCRDCKHRMHNGTCTKVMKRKPDDGYCDEGELKQY